MDSIRKQSRIFSEIDNCFQSGRSFLFAIGFDPDLSLIHFLDEIDPGLILYDINGITNAPKDTPLIPLSDLNPEPEPFTRYLDKFNRVRKELQNGNSYLLNLTCKTPLNTDVSLENLFSSSTARYKLWVKDRFTVFSPECFVRMQGENISTFPMKGTRVKENDESRGSLLGDEKESAEHATITDLLRNDLGMVCDSVEVKKYRYIDEIRTTGKTLLQVSSEIRGTIMDEYKDRPGSLLEKILPAGSVTGAPKQKTVEIIRATEDFERGWFTGVMGVWDGKKMDTGVMIRFVEQEEGRLWFKSGGGITYMSKAREEYNEMIQKIYVPVS